MSASQCSNKERNAFGLWIVEQNANRKKNGALSEVQSRIRGAYTTVFNAQFGHVTRSLARRIEKATRGAVRAADIANPDEPKRKSARRTRKVVGGGES